MKNYCLNQNENQYKKEKKISSKYSIPTVQLLNDGLIHFKKLNKKMIKIDHLNLKNN